MATSLIDKLPHADANRTFILQQVRLHAMCSSGHAFLRLFCRLGLPFFCPHTRVSVPLNILHVQYAFHVLVKDKFVFLCMTGKRVATAAARLRSEPMLPQNVVGAHLLP